MSILELRSTCPLFASIPVYDLRSQGPPTQLFLLLLFSECVGMFCMLVDWQFAWGSVEWFHIKAQAMLWCPQMHFPRDIPRGIFENNQSNIYQAPVPGR